MPPHLCETSNHGLLFCNVDIDINATLHGLKCGGIQVTGIADKSYFMSYCHNKIMQLRLSPSNALVLTSCLHYLVVTQFSIISWSSDHLTLFHLLQRDQSLLLTCLTSITQFSIISRSSDLLTLFHLLQRDQSVLLTCLTTIYMQAEILWLVLYPQHVVYTVYMCCVVMCH